MAEHLFSLWCGVGGNTVYPRPDHAGDVVAFVSRCAEAGITTLHPTLVLDDYLPAFAAWGDERLLASAPTIVDYYQTWNPWPLLVQTARQRGIETRPYLAINSHGWQMPKTDSLVGENFPYVLGYRFALQHPEYWARTRDGRTTVELRNIITLSPAHPEVRSYQTQSLCAIVRRYGLTGIQLEYISEAVDAQGIAVTGYEEAMVSAFRQQTGRDAFALPNGDAAWLRFRATFIGLQVKELHDALAQLATEMGHPLELSVSVTAREPEDYIKVYQDWPAWVTSGWVDRVCLWHKELDAGAIHRRTAYAATITRGRCHLTAEIAIYNADQGDRAAMLQEAARASLDAGADSLGVYRADAVHVHGLWPTVAAIGRMAANS